MTATLYTSTAHRQYLDALESARHQSDLIAAATSAPADMPHGARYFLSADGRSGYGVTSEDALIGVFSLDRGRGDALVAGAVAHGARHLDCFDGYLPTLYARHGFVESRRESNWTPGGPDVVYMSRP